MWSQWYFGKKIQNKPNLVNFMRAIRGGCKRVCQTPLDPNIQKVEHKSHANLTAKPKNPKFSWLGPNCRI